MSPLPCRTQRGDDAGVAVRAQISAGHARGGRRRTPQRHRTRLGAIIIAQRRRIAPGAPTKKAR